MIEQSELKGSVAAFGSRNQSFFWFTPVIGQSELNGSVANPFSFWLMPTIGQGELNGSVAASCS